ncbi:MAG TPA: hypothetical protein VGK64_27180 [Bryobacteraceae bacterium]
MSTRIKRRTNSFLQKKVRRGFQGYPVATVAFYGPDDQRASKVAVAIMPGEDAEPLALERWFSKDRDLRTDLTVAHNIQVFVEKHGVKSIVMADRILGCPNEEGIDYPEGQVCSQCPFWANRDRWTGEVKH